MGTKVHCKSYLPGYYSMRDLNEDSSSSSWPLFYGDNPITNGQYYNGFVPRNTIDGYPGYDKDALKQKMLEHEAVFKRQVFELHRLYRIQREMMDEVKRKELHGHQASIEPSSSSNFQGSGMPSEDVRKWHMAGFPLLNSGYNRPSVSGVEIVNSPMSCTKGNNNMQHGQFLFQNGSTSKESEALDSRPLKVRKKLFDLQLPADEYIDTEEGEKLPENKLSNISIYHPNGNQKGGPENSAKLLLCGRAGLKTDFREEVASCLRNSSGLADLNEPVPIEEAVAPSSSVDFLGRNSFSVEAKGINQFAVSNAGHLSVTGEIIHIRDGFLVNSSVESIAHERGHLSQIYEAGSSKSNIGSLTQGLRQDNLPKPSHPMQSLLNSVHNPPPTYPPCFRRDEVWRDVPRHELESSNRHHNDHSSNTIVQPLAASQPPNSYPFFGSSFTGSWAHTVSSWAKPTSNLNQNTTLFESVLKSSAETDRNLKPPSHGQEHYGGKWQVNVGSRWNAGLGNEETTVNGFYHGSASGSKDAQIRPQSTVFDYPNCLRSDNVVSDRSNDHGFGKFPKGSQQTDSKPVIDINLNEEVSKSSSHEPVILQDLNMNYGKGMPEDHTPALPWLKPKTAHGKDNRRSEPSGDSSSHHASSGQLCCKSEAVQDLNETFVPKMVSNDSELVRSTGVTEAKNVKKILGVPIFAMKNEPSVISMSASVDYEGKTVNNERLNRIIDINLECEPDEQMAAEEPAVEDERKATEDACVRGHIDLNSCVSDHDDTSSPSHESQRAAGVEITLDIDLEAPVLPEIEEEDNTPSRDNIAEVASLQSVADCSKNEIKPCEALRDAAETILAISSWCPEIQMVESSGPPSEAALAESLLWFIDVVSQLEKETRDASTKRDVSEEIDDFETMTLQLKETKEEDYMPAPFVPELPKTEDMGTNMLSMRSRRGQSRRGRQRRDFQRDILPGLASLSRHEVTEDLQTFGGMMRATGHAWNSGLTRRNGGRNGGGRGRRRTVVVETVPTPIPSPVCPPPLVQQLTTIEGSLEDRSLTGWGKTTRRPRRQRCPAGNQPTVVLT